MNIYRLQKLELIRSGSKRIAGGALLFRLPYGNERSQKVSAKKEAYETNARAFMLMAEEVTDELVRKELIRTAQAWAKAADQVESSGQDHDVGLRGRVDDLLD